MSAERWLHVVGWEGIYEVSDQGRVRRVGSSKPRVATPNHRGYLQLVLSHGPRRAAIRVHTSVLQAFVGPRPDGMQACHENGVNTDNRLTNLRWDTPASNAADRIRHGNQYRPSSEPTCQRGHRLSGDNLHTRERNGYTMRTCRACTNERDRARRRAAKAAAAVVLALAALPAVAVAAVATPGPGHKELICHPVNGAGQTGTGWTLVDVDKASSHFDDAGNPKHTSHDGRTDSYAVNGACPVVSTPSPTTTRSTPSPTTTLTTKPSPTSTGPSPSLTSSTVSTPSPSTQTATATSSTAPPATSSTRSTASPAPSMHTDTTPPASPRRSVPSSTVAPPELARTGFEAFLVVLAAGLLGLGVVFTHLARKGARHAR